MDIIDKNEMYNDAKKRRDDTKALTEKYPNMATLQFSLKNWTEMVDNLEKEICHFLDQYLYKCEFNDECDECGNQNQEQSWAIMSLSDVTETEKYLCQTCAIVYAKDIKDSNDAFEVEMQKKLTP